MIGLGALFLVRGILANPSRRPWKTAFGRLLGLLITAGLLIALVTAVFMAIGLKDGR